MTSAYSLIAQIYAGEKQFDKVDEIIARGLEENPRRAYHFHTVAGSIYRQVGELERALTAFKKAVLRGPFGRREGSKLRVKQLEKAIARRQRGL